MASSSLISLRRVAVGFGVVAFVFVLVGLVYLIVPEKSLVVLPGHVAGSADKHSQRGLVLVGIGVMAFIGNLWSYSTAKRIVDTSSGDRSAARPEA